MSRHETAVRFIDRVLSEYPDAPLPPMIEGSADMAIELSYAHGDIDDGLYDHYKARLRSMKDQAHEQFMEQSRRFA